MTSQKKVVLLERDGTINHDSGYINKAEMFKKLVFKFTPVVFEQIHASGYDIVIATNQSGISKGLINWNEVRLMNQYLTDVLHADYVFYCPHHPDDNCPCRKPQTGMLDSIIEQVDWPESYSVGDKTADIQLGQDLNAKTVLVFTGRAGNDKQYVITPDHMIKDIRDLPTIIRLNEDKQ